MDNRHKHSFVGDSPLEQAQEFNFDRISTTLTKFISNSDNPTPFSICINGSWGSGKTSLMRTVAYQLKSISEKRGDKHIFIPIWFEPWKLTDESQILNSLVNLVLRQIEDSGGLFTNAPIEINRKDALRLLSQRFLEVNPDDISAFYQWSSRLKGSFLEVEDLFRKVTQDYLVGNSPKVFVIFIDDLDRCPPSRVVTVLETVKLFFNMQGFIFVFGMDVNQVTKYIVEIYKSFTPGDAITYLEKMFQMVFPMPSKDEQSLINYVSSVMKRMDLDISNKDLLRALVDVFGRNLRNLKIFLNNFNFQRHIKVSKGKVPNDEILFKWQYVETMLESTFDLAIQYKSLDILVAIEFIAQGGLIGNPQKRGRYIQYLSQQHNQFVPLVIWSLVWSDGLSDLLPEKLLDGDQRMFLSAIQEDGNLRKAMSILKQGDVFLLDQDLSEMAYLTRRETNLPVVDNIEYSSDSTVTFTRGFIVPADTWDKAGDLLSRQENYQAAYYAYLAALLQDLNNVIYWTDLANTYRHTKHYEATKALIKKAYSINPEYLNLINAVAFFYDIELKDNHHASLFYRKALMLGHNGDSVPYNLAKILKDLGDPERAFAFALKAYSINPKDNPNQSRAKTYAEAIGKSNLSFEEWNETLINELNSAFIKHLLNYPLSPDEEMEIEALIKSFPELEASLDELSAFP